MILDLRGAGEISRGSPWHERFEALVERLRLEPGKVLATIGASEHLPAGGLNAEGIPPDVRIEDDRADPCAVIVEHPSKRR